MSAYPPPVMTGVRLKLGLSLRLKFRLISSKKLRVSWINYLSFFKRPFHSFREGFSCKVPGVFHIGESSWRPRLERPCLLRLHRVS